MVPQERLSVGVWVDTLDREYTDLTKEPIAVSIESTAFSGVSDSVFESPRRIGKDKLCLFAFHEPLDVGGVCAVTA